MPLQHAVMYFNSQKKAAFWASIAWAIGFCVCMGMLAGTLKKIKYDYSDALDAKLGNDDEFTLAITSKLQAMVDDPTGCFANASSTDKTVLKADIASDVQKYLLLHESDRNHHPKYKIKPRRVGGLYGIVEKQLVKLDSDHACRGGDSDALDLKQKFKMEDMTYLLSERFHRLQLVMNEIYVLDMSYDLTWLSFGLFTAGALVAALVHTVVTNDGPLRGHLMQWAYSSATYLSFFSAIIVFILAITREFWVRPWAQIGLVSVDNNLTLTEGTPNTVNDSGADMDVPFGFWNARLHKNVEVLVICSFVFQCLYLAAHQVVKYGQLVKESEVIFNKIKTGTALGQINAKSGIKVKYAPLISVAR